MASGKPLIISANEGVAVEAGVNDTITPGALSATGINGVSVDANGQRVVNVATPTAATDATSKAYVDARSAMVGFSSNIGAATLAAGDPVTWSSTPNQLAKANAATDALARAIGVVLSTNAGPPATATVVSLGIAPGVLTAATAGQVYFLAAGGGLTTSVPTTAGARVVKIGYAINATDLFVQVSDLARRAG